MIQKTGKLFLIFGPSGVGKTTLVKALLAQTKYQGVLQSICSYTTRTPRPGEQEGVDYYFITPQDFQAKEAQGFFLETSSAYQAGYGSSYKAVQELLAGGVSGIMVIDRHGAQQVLAKMPTAVTIFIAPLNEDVLRQRLVARTQKTTQDVEFRLKKAHQELMQEKAHSLACYSVVNDDLEQALCGLEQVIDGELKA